MKNFEIVDKTSICLNHFFSKSKILYWNHIVGPIKVPVRYDLGMSQNTELFEE